MEVVEIYTRVKEVHGRRYKYLVTCKRIEGEVRQRVVKYIGPVDPIYKISKRKKTNASIYVRNLSDEERNCLKKATKSTHAFVMDRAKIILLSSERMFARQIADRISCDTDKVRVAIKAFNKNGLKALERGKAKGAVSKFTDKNKKEILKHFSKGPRGFGHPLTIWTLPRFRKHLIESKIIDSISIETLRQIIMKAGAKLKRNKRWQYSNDKEFHKKNAK